MLHDLVLHSLLDLCQLAKAAVLFLAPQLTFDPQIKLYPHNMTPDIYGLSCGLIDFPGYVTALQNAASPRSSTKLYSTHRLLQVGHALNICHPQIPRPIIITLLSTLVIYTQCNLHCIYVSV